MQETASEMKNVNDYVELNDLSISSDFSNFLNN